MTSQSTNTSNFTTTDKSENNPIAYHLMQTQQHSSGPHKDPAQFENNFRHDLLSPSNSTMQQKSQSLQLNTHRRKLPQISRNPSTDTEPSQIGNPTKKPTVQNSAQASKPKLPNHSAPIKQHSLTSSEEDDFDADEDFDEIRSTTEYTTGDDIDVERYSPSERCKIPMSIWLRQAILHDRKKKC